MNECCAGASQAKGFLIYDGHTWNLCHNCNQAYRRDISGRIVRVSYTTWLSR